MKAKTSTFDIIAEEYDDSIPPHVSTHYLEKRIRFLRSVFPPGSRLLDVGCGTGTLSQRLIEESFQVFGVDDSEGMLKVALSKKVKATRTRAQSLPFADESFDGAVCVAVMHHLGTAAAVDGAIVEMLRVTRKGGSIVIWDHNPLNPYWPLLMHRVPQDDGSERLVPLKEILGVVSRSKADKVRTYRLGFVPDFIPRGWLPMAQRIEKRLEGWSISAWVAAHNIVVVTKR